MTLLPLQGGSTVSNMGPLQTELLRLKSENLRLKWVIAQMMQRWSKDGYALFLKHNKTGFGILIDENDKQVSVRIKARDDDVSNTAGQVDPN